MSKISQWAPPDIWDQFEITGYPIPDCRVNSVFCAWNMAHRHEIGPTTQRGAVQEKFQEQRASTIKTENTPKIIKPTM